MALPLNSHPIFNLRKLSIIIAAIGFVLCLLSIPAWNGEIPNSCAFLLASSGLFCGSDIVLYAIKKAEDPDNDPEWPKLKWMIGDVLLAIILQFVFWPTVSMWSWLYDPSVLLAYGALAAFLCSLVHACSFWRQLIARSKSRWLADLAKQPCARCGYNDHPAEPNPRPRRSHEPRQNTFIYAGPTANFSEANILTPQSPDSALEEGLLIGSETGSRYGSIPDPEPIIREPQEVVVGKGKKKKPSPAAVSGAFEKKAEI